MSYTTHRGKRVSHSHAAMLSAYERKTGRAIYINQGARTIAEQTWFWNHQPPIAAYPSQSAPHIKYGREHHAQDINDWLVGGVMAFYRSQAVSVALNVRGEPWHMDTLLEDPLIRAAKRLSGPAPLPTIRKGSHGAGVQKLQVYLRGAGYLPAKWHVHRSYTIFVRRAVRRFQKDHGLPVDGIVGPRTWAALKRAQH